MTKTALENLIQQQANQCVKCGLCLPHCPTYTVTENECESPRGRIALMDALAKQQIPLSDKTRLYLDHCLTCRACEAVCPAHVEYGQLIDHTRELMRNTLPIASQQQLPNLLTFAMQHPGVWRLAAFFLWLYQHSKLQWLMRKTGFLKLIKLQRVDALLTPSIQLDIIKNYYPAVAHEQGCVALFTGCINQLVDRATLTAAIKVLTHCGYSVYIPKQQCCCGALHQHAGIAATAKQLATENIAAFAHYKIEKIITIASGCSAALQEYAQWLPTPAADTFQQKVMDISQFLTNINWPEQLSLTPLAKEVILHTPCTLRNVLRQAQAPMQLLKKIPALKLIPLTNNYKDCCGAAGLYTLEHPVMADELLNKTLQHLPNSNADYLITSNIGCALHLNKGLQATHSKIRVLHPVVLIANQISK